ncbi:hypothetical protein EDC56_2806 [Sinobacterium caligoides]|uniref:Uncharacterized protein n=1 Tax=Sinobacterium caligoides TaxID=933926 RepID=A0A3N2DK38_9GAMM|nr:hypothetical protein EDC56_2806 [Sinobacterium caligoides]
MMAAHIYLPLSTLVIYRNFAALDSVKGANGNSHELVVNNFIGWLVGWLAGWLVVAVAVVVVVVAGSLFFIDDWCGLVV